MCPYFVATRPVGYCGCYGDGLFRPSLKRGRQHCGGKFMDCPFYQLEMKPIIIKSVRGSKSDEA